MVVYDRWFIVPQTGTGTPEDKYRPKYTDVSGISGFSGTPVDPTIVTDHYPALIQTYPNVPRWFIVRMYGDGNEGWDALNQIHNYYDTRTLADHAHDVAPILNAHFPNMDQTGEEWASSFSVR
jgi:hypothetical protein